MTESHSKTFDAIVVGGGHNGLTAAAYLARAGLSTLVLERREIVGGACVTEEIAPGCRASTTSYIASMLRPEVIRDLSLARHGLRMVPCDPALLVPFPDGTVGALVVRPRAHGPRAFEAFPRGRADVRPGGRRAQEAGALPAAVLPGAAAGRAHPRSRADCSRLLRVGQRFRGISGDEIGRMISFLTGSLGDFLDRNYESEKVKTLFLANNVYGKHGGPYQPGTALGLLFHLLSRRRARAPGLLRTRHGRHGRDHPGDGGRGTEARSGDPHLRSGGADRRARRARARRGAGGRHAISRRASCCPTPIRSVRSSRWSTRPSCPTSSCTRSAASRWTARAPRSTWCSTRSLAFTGMPARAHDLAAHVLHPGSLARVRRALLRPCASGRDPGGALGRLRGLVECRRLARAGGPPRHDLLRAVRSLSSAGGQLGREARDCSATAWSGRSASTRPTSRTRCRAPGADAARSRARLRPDRGQHLSRGPAPRAAVSSCGRCRAGRGTGLRSMASISAAPARIPGGGVTGAPGHNAAHQVLRDWKKRATEEPRERPARPYCGLRDPRRRRNGRVHRVPPRHAKGRPDPRRGQGRRRRGRQRPLLGAGPHALQLPAWKSTSR